MTKSVDSPYIFTWSGTLKAGEMKISCDKQSDWNGDWFMADKNGKTPTGEVETALFVTKSDAELSSMYPDADLGGLDYKWNIQEAGSYQITIDPVSYTHLDVYKRQVPDRRRNGTEASVTRSVHLSLIHI